MAHENFISTYTKILNDIVDVKKAVLDHDRGLIEALSESHELVDFGVRSTEIIFVQKHMWSGFDLVMKLMDVKFLEPRRFTFRYNFMQLNLNRMMDNREKLGEFCLEILKVSRFL